MKQLKHFIARYPDSILVFSLLLIGLSLYGQLIHGYFATDEWWAMSFAIYSHSLRAALTPAGVYTPLANLLILGLYQLFKVNALPWALLTILLHLVNVCLVYWLLTKLSKQRLIGFMTAGLFTLVPMGSQFLSQFSMMPTAGFGYTLGLASLLFYVYRRPFWSVLLLGLSLGFTAYAVSLVPVFVLVELVLLNRRDWRINWWRPLPNLGLFSLYLAVQRYILSHGAVTYDRPIAGQSVIGRLIEIGLKIYELFGELILNQTGRIDTGLTLKLSSVFLLAVFLGLIGLALRRQWDLFRLGLFGLLFSASTIALFSSLNTVTLDAAYPGRYLYLVPIGIGTTLSALLIGLTAHRSISRLPLIISVSLFIGAAFYYWPKTNQTIMTEITLGQVRQKIMQIITSDVTKPLPNEALFCFTSNTSHYGQPPDRLPLPFVHNFAFNIAVVYRPTDPEFRNFFGEAGIFLNPAA